jgi:hypothetical protein
VVANQAASAPKMFKNAFRRWHFYGKATQTGQALPEGVYYLIFKYADKTVSQNLYIKN